MHKKIINAVLGTGLGIALMVSVVYLMLTVKGFSFKDVIDGKVGIAQITKAESNNDDSSIYEIADHIHKMSNNLIIAPDGKIWGRENMDKKNIDYVLNLAENAHYTATNDIYIRIIKNWKAGNFDNIVEDHNFVWSILGGTVGKAIQPDITAVAAAKDGLK